MSNTARKDLHDLVDALDRVDPLAALPDEERDRLHASLREAEAEIAAGLAVPADAVLRELRAAK
ncbi:MAG TPA: hypothetical protein VFP50_01035 [Anaeromyxobacteraceae bacterium]|nr:hypothetical protein [Anaeromyxobacteraceae bacterium]